MQPVHQPSSRRAVLLGLAATPLAGKALGSTEGTTSETCPDTALLALGRDLEEVDRLCDAAFERLNDAEELAPYRPEPEVLIATSWDMGNALPMPTAFHDVRGRTWTRAQIEEIRSRTPRREDTFSARRRAEILAAYDTHAALVKADDDAFGISALAAASDALMAKKRGIAARIVETPAVGVAGLQVKARALVALYGEVPTIEATDADSEAAWKSIVADLIAMGGTA